MTHEDLKKKLAEKPFGAFSLTMADGSRYTVHHPDTMLVANRTAILLLPREEGSEADNACR